MAATSLLRYIGSQPPLRLPQCIAYLASPPICGRRRPPSSLRPLFQPSLHSHLRSASDPSHLPSSIAAAAPPKSALLHCRRRITLLLRASSIPRDLLLLASSVSRPRPCPANSGRAHCPPRSPPSPRRRRHCLLPCRRSHRSD
jgi:hypothetical protein